MTSLKNPILKRNLIVLVVVTFFIIISPFVFNRLTSSNCSSANYYDTYTVSASSLLSNTPPLTLPTYVSLGISKTASYGNLITLCLLVGDKGRDFHNVKATFHLPDGINIKKGSESTRLKFNSEATHVIEIEVTEPSRYVIGVVVNEGDDVFGFNEIVLDYKDGQITFYNEWGKGWSGDSWKNTPANSIKISSTELPDLYPLLNWPQREKPTSDIWYTTSNRELTKSIGYASLSEPFVQVTNEQRIGFVNFYHKWFKNNGWKKIYAKKSSSLTWGSYEEEEYIYEKNNYYVNFGIKYTLYGNLERTYQFFINHS